MAIIKKKCKRQFLEFDCEFFVNASMKLKWQNL